MPYIQVNDLSMFYERHGQGEPLLLIHGAFGTHSSHWRTQVPLFSQHFQVVAMDLRGHGQTSNPADDLSLELFARDISALVGALDLGPSHIFGFSLGGVIALTLGVDYPDVVKSLVLWGVNHRPDKRFLERISYEHELLEDPDRSRNLRKQHAGAQGGQSFERLSQLLKREAFRRRSFSEEEIRSIRPPTLVCLGDRDEFVALELGIELYRMLPNSALFVIPNSGHIVVGEKLETFNRVVLDHLLQLRH